MAVAVVLTGCASSSRASTKDLPDAVLASFATGGKALDLGDVRGPTVIALWASWCGPCRRDLPFYQSFSQRSRGRVKVIGVDFKDTNRAKAEALVQETGVSFPLYSDPDASLGARVLPEVLLVDAKGHVVHREYVEITSVQQLDDLVEKHLKVAS